MSSTAADSNAGSSSDSAEPAKTKPKPKPKPKQASRSVSLLTPEQLQRKRAQDRESQRQTRGRVKQTISHLEKRIELLAQELHMTRLENASLQQKNQLAPPGTIGLAAPPLPIEEPEFFPEGAAAIMDVMQQNATLPQFADVNSQLSDSILISGQISTQPGGATILDPSHFYLYDGFEQQPMALQVWQARPLHYPATCKFDKIILELIDNLRPINQAGGTALEFTNQSFPHVSTLLNPQQNSLMYPLSAGIVSKVIFSFTMDSLPEQIAIMWNMCTIVRWMITGSEEDYQAMPDWMRPGAAQVVTAHPVWVDLIPWPKARDRLCREAYFHSRHEEFKNIINQTLSINWPYRPQDTLIKVSPSEYAINPVFVMHLRNLDNWTVGPSFFKMYPQFEKEAKMGKPRMWGHTFE